jgi:dTDP-4-amino-4,6-dideoxygalactose transaminase
MYYVLVGDGIGRQPVLDAFRHSGVHSVFHYVPLHSSPAGLKYARAHGQLPVTDRQSARLIRLPMWNGLVEPQLDRVIDVLTTSLTEARQR